MTEKYLVVQLDEREKTIAKLKASLYALSIDEMVKQSVNDMQGSVPTITCSYCNGQTTVTRKKPKQHTEIVCGKEQVIQIINYPQNYCEVCDAEYDDMDVSIHLKKLIKFEILKSIRLEQPLPEELDFEELLKM
ncbi:hypothetical protein D5F11_008575 [Siminovitchia terrae]|uniref:Uncharacterized protein n=1 Tax=Siminovitchia terrae TaxID=1914933 RepID=A0A429X9P5_SIMTE|nr:hypothetical protein [Siminovitchia terrae]RST60110.1 hypothetical protein D5F11_008575 [Siminovitchia terrae]